MRYTIFDRIRDYRNDPYFPTPVALAVVYALRDWVLGRF